MGAINSQNNVIMYNYKDSAFAAPTLDLERSTEYSPLTISSYNVGKTILDRSTYKGYNWQDVIISFSKNTGSNAAGSYYGGNLFKDQNANKVGYFYADMGSSANTSSQGWENTDGGWKYKDSNGSYVTNTWVK